MATYVGAVRRLQTVGGNTGTVSTVTSATLSITPTAGSALILAVGWRGAAGVVASPTISDGTNTWNATHNAVRTTANMTVALWYAVGVVGSAVTITIDWGTGNLIDAGYCCVEFAGLSATNPVTFPGNVEVYAGSNGNSASFDTTTSANAMSEPFAVQFVVFASGGGVNRTFSAQTFAPATVAGSLVNETNQGAGSTGLGTAVTVGFCSAQDALGGSATAGGAPGLIEFTTTCSAASNFAILVEAFRATPFSAKRLVGTAAFDRAASV